MASSYLVAYDIVKPKRLRQVHKCLLSYGIPLQYSVFYVREEPDVIQNMWEELQQVIDPDSDDIRAYPIQEFDLCSWTKVNASLSQQAILIS